MANEFMTERKRKVLETFEKILPLTTAWEDELLITYGEGILKFKTEKESEPKPA